MTHSLFRISLAALVLTLAAQSSALETGLEPPAR